MFHAQTSWLRNNQSAGSEWVRLPAASNEQSNLKFCLIQKLYVCLQIINSQDGGG
jgi:hypothetical protein